MLNSHRGAQCLCVLFRWETAGFGSLTLLLLAGLVFLTMLSGSAGAATSLANGNSFVLYDTETSSGLSAWTVDGVQNLNGFADFYRIGATGGELPVIGLTQTGFTSTANTLDVSYAAADFTVATHYQLLGGAAGSGQSTLKQTNTITNTTGQTLNLSFFTLADFDVSESFGENSAAVTAAMALQTGPDGRQVITTASRAADHFQADFYPALQDSFSDQLPTTLNDNGGPISGDVNYALQWNLALAPGQSIDIGLVSVVPEPLTLAMLGLGAMPALRRRRMG